MTQPASAAPPVGAASAVGTVFQSAPMQNEIVASAWPRWFWPGVAAVLIVSVAVFSLRLVLRSGSDEAPAPMVNTTDEPVPESYAVGANASSPQTLTPELTPPSAPNTSPKTDKTPADASATNVNSTAPITKSAKTADSPPATANQSTSDGKDATAAPSASSVSQVPADGAADKPPANDASNQNSNENTAASVTPPLPAPVADGSPETVKAGEDTAASIPAGEHQPAPRTLKRASPRTVNITARLADSVPGIDVQNQPLIDFLETISAMSTVPITLDADAVHDLGQAVTAPVQLHLTDATVAEVLQAALEPLRLEYQMHDGQLIVGYPPQDKPRQVRYAINDLVKNDSELVDLAELIRLMVYPASWQQVGGKGTMIVGKGQLTVNQTESAHTEIVNFCQKLRVARGLPLKGRFDPSRFVLNTREDKARELLDKPTSANFSTPTPLADVVKWLRQATGATILIDHEALAREGMSAESECSALVANKSLAKLLDDLTASADLTWRVIDERTIEITSRPAALARMDVEFYPSRDLISNTAAEEKLIAQIKEKVEPQLWGEASEKPADHAAMVLDKPSGALIVRAPQRVQAQVEAELATRRGGK